MDWLLKNGRVVDPSQGLDGSYDVLVRDGRIVSVTPCLSAPEGVPVLDVAGMIVVPGLVDPHVHLREPGREDEETIESGCRAAIAGGFTAVACMPNTEPALDKPSLVAWVAERAAAAGWAKVHVIGAITKGRKGESLAEMGQMVQAGAIAFSDDGSTGCDSHLLRTALGYSRQFGGPIVEHCEDPDLAGDGVAHEGVFATLLGLRGIPAAAEETIVARDIRLAELTGAHLHVAHVSSGGTVELIRRAKERGLPVTAEATPHHFTLDHSYLKGYDSNLRVSPPIRGEADRGAIIAGLADGTIDCIASDHAPHTAEEKDVPFDQAPPGMVGLETSLGLAIKELVEPGHLSWSRLIECMSTAPARVFGLQAGTLAPERPADITVIDPQVQWEVQPQAFQSRSSNTPFGGWQLHGRAHHVLVGGQLKLRSGRLVGCGSNREVGR